MTSPVTTEHGPKLLWEYLRLVHLVTFKTKVNAAGGNGRNIVSPFLVVIVFSIVSGLLCAFICTVQFSDCKGETFFSSGSMLAWFDT